MRITTGMVQRSTLADLNRVSERVTDAQKKASSGRQITKPSDDPYNAARALKLRESLAGVRQYERNIEDAQGWQEATELALSNITDSVQRARELLVQGASDTTDAVSRESIAKEVDELIAAVKEAANSNFQGRYIFAGTRTDEPPYPVGADDTYQGHRTAVVARQVGPSVSLDIGVTGLSFLGDGAAAGDGKLLDTLRSIAADLRSGDTAAMQADLSGLDTNLDQLLGVRAFNGARQNRLDAALGRMSQLEEVTLGQLSETEDADIAATLITLNSQQTAYQAALKVGANILQSSLMDFLR
ncbi:MAG TPA: flagellar hook-associated protein FlgL [Solirubrobacteraceae bacterium]|nr:flagellar hook-associated protein FlgL [Solirubrobacteraceae bacterium]